jgi:hypothetical protein
MKSKTNTKRKQKLRNTSKKENKNLFQKILDFSLSTLGIITILFVIILLALLSVHAIQLLKQGHKYSAAQESCNADPVVIVESEDWFGRNKYYDIYTSENPEYEKVKTSINSYFSSSKVYGYYCSLDEAEEATKNTLDRISSNESNYTEAERQKIVSSYVSTQAKNGVIFYAPSEQLKGFRENVKAIRIDTGMYNIGYVGNTPETQGRGEQVPINLNCKPVNEKSKQIKYGEIEGYQENGTPIYQQEDQYNLNTRLYLPKVECNLETKVGELNKQDAVNFMKSVIEIDPSIIETYELYLL